MSINAMETALWRASMNPKEASRLRENADAYLDDFRLEDQERSLLSSWDIRGIVENGVHPMVLMMAFAAVNGPEASMAYVQQVNTPK